MIDDFAKDCLLGRLKGIREALVWKLDGLSEYDIRRPLTVTGTNLLGLVKHMATLEAWYFGEVFGRPFPEALGRWQDADGSDLWVTPGETRKQIIDFYQRAWVHRTRRSKSFPSTRPATCRGDRGPTSNCSPSSSMSFRRPPGMPGTPTSCVSSSMAAPG